MTGRNSTIFAAASALIACTAGMQQTPRIPTYTQDIAPILAKKCLACHVTGGTGPFPLDSYEQVSNRTELIRTVALSRIMPPYMADSDFGSLGIIQQLTDVEELAIQKWILAKCPRGPSADALSPPVKPKVTRRDEIVLASEGAPDVKVEGTPYWRGLLIPIPKGASGFVRSMSVIPDAPKALRYAVVYLLPNSRAASIRSGREVCGGEVEGKYLLGVWAPGCAPFSLSKGLGFSLKGETALYVRAHYAPVGRTVSGGFRVRLGLTHDRNTVQPKWLTFGKESFVIQADSTPTWQFSQTVSAPTRVLAVLPEARFYVSSIKLLATGHEKEPKRLFETLRWNPYWVGNYEFADPPIISAGSELVAELTYANDPKCSMNEGRQPQPVHSGLKLENELCRLHVLTAPAISK